MDVSKCTKGPCDCNTAYLAHCNEYVPIAGDRNLIAIMGDRGDVAYVANWYDDGSEAAKAEIAANAELIVEALNVATETGRSPRELADWQVKAVAVLTRMHEWMDENMACQCEHGFICAECDLLSEAQVLLRDAGAIETSKQPRRTTIE